MAIGGGGLRGVRRALAVTCALAAFALPAMCFEIRHAVAQEWLLGSNITQRGSYNSNLLLTREDETSAFGSITIPEFKLQRTSPTSNIVLDGKFTFSEYINHSNFNSQDQNGALTIEKDLSERSKLGLDASVDRASTLTTDRDITGDFLNRPVHFVAWDVAPSWTYQLSPIDQIRLGPSYSAVDYEPVSTKTDYRFYGSSLQYSHALSELAQLTGSLSYFRYEPNGLDTKTDIYGGLVGYRYRPSERLSLDGAVGLNYRVRTESGGSSGSDSSSDVGYRLKFNANYDINEQTQASLSLSRDEEPSGARRTVTRNRASLSFNYKFSELTAFDLQASYADNESIGGSDSDSESSEGTSRFFRIGPSAIWRITEDLSLSATYQFRYKLFRADGGSASDNAAFITLRYSLQDQHWSGF